ncbi:MAG: class I tRNA ligase family protein, partial [Gammaproteobacteria bacterium]|nr:class I tRNA ligase family protein [Gammaproteobacteria bacterium]
QWIMSRLQTLKSNVASQMKGYRLYNVVPQLFSFIEDLTNWYIRLNRSRFWGESVTADKISAYSTLYTALVELSQVMAPFAPFLSEHLYRQLALLSGKPPSPESVHLCDYPRSEDNYVKPQLEEAVDQMQQVVLLGRQKREEVKIGLRTPLASLTVVNRDQQLLDEMQALDGYIAEELNVRKVSYSADEGAYIELVAKPNFPLLGKRLGKRMKMFTKAIGALNSEQINELQTKGVISIDDEHFSDQEIQVLQQARPGTNTVSNSRIAVDLDCDLTPELVRGGHAREMVNRVQRARKDLGFEVSDRIHVSYDCSGDLALAAHEHSTYIMSETLALEFVGESLASSGESAGEQASDVVEAQIDGESFKFVITKAADA